MSSLLDRINRETGVGDLAALLDESLEPADLHSLLLEVYRRRSSRRAVSDVAADYAANRLVAPSAIDPRVYMEWDAALFHALPSGFTPIELSPLAPLGTCSVMAEMSQDKSVVTARNLEVVSDATNVLALECALRRRKAIRERSDAPIDLVTSHRLVRPHAPIAQGYSPHFRLFGLCSAGRNGADAAFHERSMRAHLGILLRAMRAFLGEAIELRVALTDLESAEPRERCNELLRVLAEDHPSISFGFNQDRTTGRMYYRDICYHIYSGDVQLADGGGVDWMSVLLSSARERGFIGGVGSDRVCAMRVSASR